MNFNEYMPLALRTAKPLATPRQNLRHCLIGMITELGEVCSEIKRIVIYEKPMSDSMRDHMIEELGDFQWYVPVGMLACGITGTPVLDAHSDLGSTLSENMGSLDEVPLVGALLCGSISTILLEMEGDLAPGSADGEFARQIFAGAVTFVDAVAVMLGTTGDMTRAENIDKLKARFPDAYSNEAAEARADKGGLPHTLS